MSETVSVRIPREQYARLVELAKQKGVMISWLLGRVLDRYLLKHYWPDGEPKLKGKKELQP